jgi:hypothetical protein
MEASPDPCTRTCTPVTSKARAAEETAGEDGSPEDCCIALSVDTLVVAQDVEKMRRIAPASDRFRATLLPLVTFI